MRKMCASSNARQQDRVELARRREVVAERLFDDDARALRAVGLRELLDDGAEQHRRDREVVRRMLRVAELLAQRVNVAGSRVVAVDVAQERQELGERGLVEAAVLLEAVAGARAELVERSSPAWRRRSPARSRCPRLIIACSDGKIFLYARSPVAPKKTSASEWIGHVGHDAHLPASRRWPPNSKRIADRACSGSRPRRAS